MLVRPRPDKLAELFKTDRKSYEEKWGDIGLFVKYGIVTDQKFAEKAKDFLLLKNTITSAERSHASAAVLM